MVASGSAPSRLAPPPTPPPGDPLRLFTKPPAFSFSIPPCTAAFSHGKKSKHHETPAFAEASRYFNLINCSNETKPNAAYALEHNTTKTSTIHESYPHFHRKKQNSTKQPRPTKERHTTTAPCKTNRNDDAGGGGGAMYQTCAPSIKQRQNLPPYPAAWRSQHACPIVWQEPRTQSLCGISGLPKYPHHM